MSRKTVLVAGASGLVGYAAMKHFSTNPEWDVIAVSRRRPDETLGVRFITADLTDTGTCADIFGRLREVTHVIYAALYERPDLVAGWCDPEQIAVNDRMLRNLLEPLESTARSLQHVSVLQGTKAYGSHVRTDESTSARGAIGNARAAQLLLEPGRLPAGQTTRQRLVLHNLSPSPHHRLLAG